MKRWLWSALLVSGIPGASGLAHSGPEPVEFVVVGRSEDLSGVVQASSTGKIGPREILSRPVRSPGEILEHVPGMTVTQHSGSGKANQYFLRGFNLDHGTDFAAHLDGVPLNQPTHGHGQGYLDMNFLIPEIVESMSFQKGPYHAQAGDFSSAGNVRIRIKDRLEEGFARIETGSDGWRRFLAADSHETKDGDFLYAVEANAFDGPWDVEEDLERFNLHLRWTRGEEAKGSRISFLAYESDWTSTDQIPQRAVASGLISRLGSLDPTTGGESSRTSLNYEWWKEDSHGGRWNANAYAVRSQLNLFSNFTYLLDDPVRGDQFEQVDDRKTFGAHVDREITGVFAGKLANHRFGLNLRHDRIGEVALHRTQARRRTGTVRQDEVEQTSAGLFAETEVYWSGKLRSTFGLKAHRYSFDVDAKTLAANSGSRNDEMLNYNLGLAYLLKPEVELYFNHGTGFHSNDARGTTTRIDPNTGLPTAPVDPLVQSRGSEIGVRTNVNDRWKSTVTLWTLDLDSELVFVGDAGTTEPSRPSRRHGIEWNNHLTLADGLTLHGDVSHSKAYFRDSDPAGNAIPNSVETTLGIGLQYSNDQSGVYGGLNLRAFQGRPLIEDNSVRAPSTRVVNAQIGRRRGRFDIRLDVLNLFDSEDHDITYFFDSRLAGEPAAGVSDIHFHPVLPRTVRLAVGFQF